VIAIPKDFSTGSEFPKIDHATWVALVETEIKDAPFAKRMTSHLYEGIEIEPLFTEESFPTAGDPSGFPGGAPFARGGTLLGNTLNGWDIRQEQAHPDPATANAQILADLEEGVTSIDLRLDGAGSLGLDADDPMAASLTGREGVSLSCAADFDRRRATLRPAWRLQCRSAAGSDARRRPADAARRRACRDGGPRPLDRPQRA
jgi:methylmalonyl-CoA mutase